GFAIGLSSAGHSGRGADARHALRSNPDHPFGADHVTVQTGRDEAITALTSGGINELRDMLASARASERAWHEFLEDFVSDPDVAERCRSRPWR
ncbi:hypothetical protein V8J36_21970, partial [Frigidibacter sp. MR17.14]|uniref:hypothetical protein n=1 Tax=Frigidibacter sp. MR17.14 TaxID=3126509 RepID=UPI003012B2D8